MNPRTVTVISPGPLSTVQDLGRPGFGYLGVGRSGAADRNSDELANRILGNEKAAATIEMTLGRLRMRFDVDTTIVLTGAPCGFRLTPRPVSPDQVVTGEMNRATTVLAGQELRVGAPRGGLRTYLGILGGITVPPVLGSRSTDTMSGIGPEILSAGMVLPIGTGTARSSAPPSEYPPPREYGTAPQLSVIPGPRDDWFTPEALETLCAATWSVTQDANRVGVRLSGPVLQRSRQQELPPEPMVAGAIQVPPNGQPIIFLPDHPVTGGYPVIGVITGEDQHWTGQLRPGQSVRFRVR